MALFKKESNYTELLELIKELKWLETSLWEDLHNNKERLSEKIRHFNEYSQLAIKEVKTIETILKQTNKQISKNKKIPIYNKINDLLFKLKEIDELAKNQINKFKQLENLNNTEEIINILNDKKLEDHCSKMSTLLKQSEENILNIKEELNQRPQKLLEGRISKTIAIAIFVLFGIMSYANAESRYNEILQSEKLEKHTLGAKPTTLELDNEGEITNIWKNGELVRAFSKKAGKDFLIIYIKDHKNQIQPVACVDEKDNWTKISTVKIIIANGNKYYSVMPLKEQQYAYNKALKIYFNLELENTDMLIEHSSQEKFKKLLENNNKLTEILFNEKKQTHKKPEKESMPYLFEDL